MITDISFIKSLTLCFLQKVNPCKLFGEKLSLENVRFNHTTPTRLDRKVVYNGEQMYQTPRTAHYLLRQTSLEIIMFYANPIHHEECKTDKYLQYVNSRLVPIGSNQTFDNRTMDHNECVMGQSLLIRDMSPYTKYLDSYFDTIERMQFINKSLDELKHLDFSSWTESDINTYHQPVIRMFIGTTFAYQCFVISIGLMFLLGPFWIVGYFYENLFRFIEFETYHYHQTTKVTFTNTCSK